MKSLSILINEAQEILEQISENAMFNALLKYDQGGKQTLDIEAFRRSLEAVSEAHQNYLELREESYLKMMEDAYALKFRDY